MAQHVFVAANRCAVCGKPKENRQHTTVVVTPPPPPPPAPIPPPKNVRTRAKKLILPCLLALLLPASAMATTLQATAANIPFIVDCCGGWFPPANTIEAVLTVIPATGKYYRPGFGFVSTAAWEVTEMTGTFNGQPLSLTTGLLGDGRSWLMSFYGPGYVSFLSGGEVHRLHADSRWFVLDASVPMHWSATPVSEVSTVITLGLGLGLLLILGHKLGVIITGPSTTLLMLGPIDSDKHKP